MIIINQGRFWDKVGFKTLLLPLQSFLTYLKVGSTEKNNHDPFFPFLKYAITCHHDMLDGIKMHFIRSWYRSTHI